MRHGTLAASIGPFPDQVELEIGDPAIVVSMTSTSDSPTHSVAQGPVVARLNPNSMMLFQAACSAIAGQMLPVSSRSRAYTKLDRGYDHPKQTDRAKHWPSCWRLLRKCQSAPRELPRSAAAGDASDDDGRRLERDRRADSAVGTATTLGE